MPRKRWTFSSEAVNQWLDSQKPSTRRGYATYWRDFEEFTGLNGDQILESRRQDKDYYWEKKVLEFKSWLLNKGKASRTARSATVGIRGFFAFHRLTLQFRRQEGRKLSESQPKFEDYRFSRDDLKRLCDYADLQEKYVITAGKSFGFRAGDFLKLTRGHLEPYIEREVPIFIGEFTTQKENVKAYPFIDSDAQPVIKLMLEKMNTEGRTDPSERMLSFSDAIQLSRTLKRVAEKAGIKYGNKRIRFHCLRKFLIDRLSSHMSESKWKQIVGKSISESAYVSPDSLREDYARAMPEITFQTTVESNVARTAKLEALKAIAKTMGFTDDDLAMLSGKKRFAKRLTIDEEIQALERAVNEKRKPQTDCTDGKHCGNFKQIPEAELLTHLQAGWRITHKLNNGDVIVES